MCLTQRFNKVELAKFKKTLPAEFPVWKMLTSNRESEYKCNNEPDFRFGVNKAGVFIGRRTRIRGRYEVGFHAFLTRYCARKYQNGKFSCIQKFYAKRSWITAAGNSMYDTQEFPRPIVVLSHIEVRDRSAKAQKSL